MWGDYKVTIKEAGGSTFCSFKRHNSAKIFHIIRYFNLNVKSIFKSTSFLRWKNYQSIVTKFVRILNEILYFTSFGLSTTMILQTAIMMITWSLSTDGMRLLVIKDLPHLVHPNYSLEDISERGFTLFNQVNGMQYSNQSMTLSKHTGSDVRKFCTEQHVMWWCVTIEKGHHGYTLQLWENKDHSPTRSRPLKMEFGGDT